MTAIGTRITETGTLVGDGSAFDLRRDLGGRYELELRRTPVDLIEKRVRLVARWSATTSSVPTVSHPPERERTVRAPALTIHRISDST